MNLLENNKKCCHFISGPSNIDHEEFKNNCQETPETIHKAQNPKTDIKFIIWEFTLVNLTNRNPKIIFPKAHKRWVLKFHFIETLVTRKFLVGDILENCP